MFTPQENETLEDLQFNNLKILQKTQGFRFGMDPILLSHFATLKPHQTVVDLGTGTGIMPILLSQKCSPLSIHAFEIQADMAHMASRSMALNGLNNIQVHHLDFTQFTKVLPQHSVNVVITNPPYGKQNATLKSKTMGESIAKHELETPLQSTLSTAQQMLTFGGKLFMCFPTTRMVELITLLSQHQLEPKRMQLVQSKADKEPYLILLEAVFHGKPFLQVLPPLVVFDEQNQMRPEVKKIYHIED